MHLFFVYNVRAYGMIMHKSDILYNHSSIYPEDKYMFAQISIYNCRFLYVPEHADIKDMMWS